MATADTTEALPFVAGVPPMPRGRSKSFRKAWHRITTALAERRVLSLADGQLVEDLIAAQADRYKAAGDRRLAARAQVEKIEAIFAARFPFPADPTVASPTPEAAPTTAILPLESFIKQVEHCRGTFAARLVPGQTVCLDADNQPYAWLPNSASAIARQYAMDVAQGSIVSGQLMKCACQRFLRDLEVGQQRGVFFDPVEAELIKNFFDSYVTEWKLQPFQVFIVVNLFAWKWASGLRRFRFLWLACGRKNGKSELLAAIGVFCLCADVPCLRPEIYSAGTKRDQAKIIWQSAKQIIRNSPQLRDAIKLLAHSIEIPDTGATFEALGADANTLDGLRTQVSLIDEIHAHPSSAVTVRLQSSTMSRPQPLQCSATTAGETRDDSWCYSQHELFSRFLLGEITDDKFFDERLVCIYMCDEGDNPADESIWIKANPNIGVSCSVDGLRSQAREFQADPQALLSFNRFHLNIWNSVVVGRSLPQDAINNAVGFTMPARGPMELRNAFLSKAQEAGVKFCGGADAGLSDDLFAFVLVTDQLATGITDTGAHVFKTVFIPWFWLPSKNVTEHAATWKVPLELWIREGWIKVAGEELVDLDVVEKDIQAICAQYKTSVIGYDKWKLETLMARLHAQSVSHCVAVPQLPSYLTTPCRDFKDGILKGTYAHLGNPVFKWMCANVDLSPSEATGGIKPAKSGGDRRRKIDGIQAAVTALQQLHDPENRNRFLHTGHKYIYTL